MSKQINNRIQIPDLISIGIYSAIYFILVGLSALAMVFLVPGYSYIFIPILAALISGTVFMLLVSKVPKFGGITIMGSVMGIFYFISGRFPFALIPSLLFAVLADLVALVFRYKRKNGLLLSYVVFSFSQTGPLIPFFFDETFYTTFLLGQGRDLEYVQQIYSGVSNYTVIFVSIAIIVAAFIGGLFGQRMLKKHFRKAGII